MNTPERFGDAMKGQLKTRTAPCGHKGCTTEVEQTYFFHRWTPEHCPPCSSQVRETQQLTKEERTKVEREQAGKAALINLRVPKLYANVTLDSFHLHGSADDQRLQRILLGVMREYVASWPDVGEDRMLATFRGGVGTGKGHVAWSVSRAVAEEHGAAVAYVRLPDLIREIRASWRDRSEVSEVDVLEKYRRKDLLFVDEVSRHSFYGQGYQHLLDILDHRVNNQRPTILTTNDDDATLTEILGPANMSRLNGCGGILEFGTDDWRSRERGEVAA
jgi:DNA replication protein DnaC